MSNPLGSPLHPQPSTINPPHTMHARFKLDSRSSVAVYHCISHTVRREFLDEAAKEILRKQLWQVADYCGIQVLT